MSYLCQNMQIFANKLGKLRLFWFFDYSFTKKEKVSPTVIRQTPPPQKIFYVVQECRTFTNSLELNIIKSYQSFGHQASLNGSFDKKNPIGIGNFTYPPSEQCHPLSQYGEYVLFSNQLNCSYFYQLMIKQLNLFVPNASFL